MPEPSLDRIRELAELLDHPELTYPSIHVTGTNGKTTTARLATAIACAHGLTSGTFISPHVISVNERISLCGEPITDEEFAETYEHLLPFLERVDGLSLRVTYFETLTALAYLFFADKPVGLGVFEVGLGGAWDATNLISGEVAVLCPIGLDHTKQLGSTIRQIATEKAGIIKEGRIAVVREQRPEALEVIERRCDEVGASLLLEGRDFGLESRSQGVGGQSFDVSGIYRSYDEQFTPLFGEHAARNAAAGVVACEALFGRALNERSVKQAVRSVLSPGRIEVVARHPLVILDGAHNPDAAGAVAQALPESFHWDRLHLVIGMSRDKDVESVCTQLASLGPRAYACSYSSPRSAPSARVAGALRDAGVSGVQEFDSVRHAVEAARAAAEPEDLILVTGSFYTVADARPLFVDS
jgi:dihydrofolate synthase/folylpolyglutamate synthase